MGEFEFILAVDFAIHRDDGTKASEEEIRIIK